MAASKAKSWTPSVGVPEDWGTVKLMSLATPRFALRLLLTVLTVLFLLIFVSYLVRMGVYDWRPLSEPLLLWGNTAFLVFSSAGMQAAKIGASAGDRNKVKIALAVGGGFAISFLLGQLWVWRELNMQGYYLSTNPANSFFYLITTVHGLHLLGGLVAWARNMRRLHNHGNIEFEQLSMSVELCALYWHFLLIVWLILFGLMLST